MNWSWLLPAGKGIPVLMYHKVWPGVSDGLTITPQRLREHWTWLKSAGYHTLTMQQYIDVVTGLQPAPPLAILITFDDGYVNNLTYAYPLLRELGWQATFFIIANTLDGRYPAVPQEQDRKMTPDQLRQLDPATVQLGLHGYHHARMGRAENSIMQQEVSGAVHAFTASGLVFERVFAYAYGARPTDKGQMDKLRQLMAKEGIKAAFRIGNKVSKVPAPDLFEIKRIDIKGTDTTEMLKIKLKKGKLHPF